MEQQGLHITRETPVRLQRDFLAAEVIRKVIGQTFSFSRPLEQFLQGRYRDRGLAELTLTLSMKEANWLLRVLISWVS